MSAALPELAERDATGGHARIYAELRHLGGVPMVALIFRHLATIPGGLEWAWGALAPAWRSGALQQAAWRIAAEAPVPAIAPIPREALVLLDMDEAGLAEAGTVLQAYNRANPENLLSVLCLLRLADRATAAGVSGEATAKRGAGDPGGIGAASCPAPGAAGDVAWTPPVAPGPLPPMVAPAAMPDAIARLLAQVADPASAGRPRVVQSLYRHFVHRPSFLALAVTLVRQRLDDGSAGRAVAAIQQAMGRAADGISVTLTASDAPDPRVREALERFGGGVIAGMIVVGAMLERVLPGGAGDSGAQVP